jgi:hypothetical protein
MKKFVLLCLIFSWGAISIEAKAPPKTADFTGNWILDMSQTKKVPDGLDTYSMVIKQDARQLNVQTKLQGNLRPDSSPTATSPQTRARVGPPGGYPGGVGPMSGPGIPVGGGPMGEGIPGSTEPSRGRIGRNNRHARTAAQAFTLYPRSAVYKLDGSETNVQLGGPTHSEATSKAAWTKGHKELKLSLAGGDSSARNGDGVAVKEQWKLSKDGQHLLIDRTVHTPGRSTTIHLVFNKQPAASGQSGS